MLSIKKNSFINYLISLKFYKYISYSSYFII